jgi:hypothetical protein
VLNKLQTRKLKVMILIDIQYIMFAE